MTAPIAPLRAPVETPRLAPLARFGAVFGWGVGRALRARRFGLVTAAAVLVGLGLGYVAGSNDDPAASLWRFLDMGVLGTAVPLIALALVAGGFGEEVQDHTLIHHLVRPVARSTVFLARFAAGAVPGLVATAAMTAAVMLGSRASLPAQAWQGTMASAALGVVTVGALYYALAALFRRGLVAGLVYTFVVEGFFQGLPGSIQKLSLTHHVRSLFHQGADAAFASVSPEVAAAVARGPDSIVDAMFFRTVSAEPWSSVSGAILVCALVAVGALAVGVRSVAGRDFALKD